MADSTGQMAPRPPAAVVRFGERMRRARTQRGLSLAHLAAVLGDGVSRQYLALIETGQRDPALSLAARLIVALDLDEVAIVRGQKARQRAFVAA